MPPYTDIQTIQNPTVDVPVEEAWFDGVRTALEYLARNRPHGRWHNSAAISILNSTLTALTFDTNDVAVGGCHSTVTNTSRGIGPDAGWHHFIGQVSFAANATGFRQIALRVNGSVIIAQKTMPNNGAGTGLEIDIPTHYQLVAGDYVELLVFQTSGGALNAAAGTNFAPAFSLMWECV